MDDLIARLRCGAPSAESWHQLAARTNRERAEAADAIERKDKTIAALSVEIARLRTLLDD